MSKAKIGFNLCIRKPGTVKVKPAHILAALSLKSELFVKDTAP